MKPAFQHRVGSHDRMGAVLADRAPRSPGSASMPRIQAELVPGRGPYEDEVRVAMAVRSSGALTSHHAMRPLAIACGQNCNAEAK